MTGSYELRDLDHAYVGQLYEGKLIIDKTFGHAAYGCSTCCGYTTVVLDPSPFDGPPDFNNEDFIHATESCGGSVDDVTDGGYNWASSNTAIATLPNRTLHTVAVGSATGSVRIQLESSHPEPSGNCLTTPRTPQQPVNVGQLVYLVGTGCTSNTDWTGLWGNSSNLLQCGLSEPDPLLPAGGSCTTTDTGTTKEGTPKKCYQITTPTCQKLWCQGDIRVADKDCTKFLDNFPVIVITVPAGCS